VPGRLEHWRSVRWELFIFGDVRDVLATRERDRVVVVHLRPHGGGSRSAMPDRTARTREPRDRPGFAQPDHAAGRREPGMPRDGFLPSPSREQAGCW
jgi:hypothetical protein